MTFQSEEQQLAAVRSLAMSALSHWDFECESLDLIKFRENAVFKLTTPEGASYALRVHRPGYHSDAGLRSELQWMAALQESGLSVPQPIPCNGNDDGFVSVAHPDVPELRQVDIFAWINGDQLGSVEEGLGDNRGQIQQIYSTIGELAARLHRQSCGWQMPEGFTRHAWDADGLTGDEPFWGPFWQLAALTDGQRDLVLRARARVREELSALDKSPTQYSMIHADFVPENLLVDGDQVHLIDFDDAGFGWHMFEIATALYFIQDEPHYELAKSALLDAYQEIRPIDESRLPLFMLARSFTYLGWIHTRPETETALELTPMLVDMCCGLAEQHLNP